MRNAVLVDVYGQPLRMRRARFDAATAGGPQRATPPQALSVFQDVTSGDRRKLVASSRNLADNSPTICGLVARFATYVIGSGLWPVSETGDDAYDSEANGAFRECANDCDVRGGISWADFQWQAFWSSLVDGDSGAILTNHSNGDPALWSVEGNDIGNPTGATTSPDYFDGVHLDALGRRIAYDVRRPLPGGGYSEIKGVPAHQFVHFARFNRPGQIRGVPLLAAALNTGQDVKEILEIEKLALKDAATKVDIITTASGELDASELVAGGGATLNGSDGEDPRTYYREIGMPESKVLRTGDTWQAYKNDRPSQTWQGFMAFLSETICLAANIPPSILLQIKVGGADTRRDLAAAERVFSMIQNRLTGPHQFGKIWNYFISSKLGNNLPDGWDRPSWQTPKAITADAGREAQQDREDVRAGLMTRREYFGRWAQNSTEQAAQVEREARETIQAAKKLSTEESIPFELAIRLLGANEENVDSQVIQIGKPDSSNAPNETATPSAKPIDSAEEASQQGQIQDTALNGAQLKSVQDIVAAVSLKQLPAEAAIELLKLALPLADEATICKMVDAAAAFTPPAQPKATP